MYESLLVLVKFSKALFTSGKQNNNELFILRQGYLMKMKVSNACIKQMLADTYIHNMHK